MDFDPNQFLAILNVVIVLAKFAGHSICPNRVCIMIHSGHFLLQCIRKVWPLSIWTSALLTDHLVTVMLFKLAA